MTYHSPYTSGPYTAVFSLLDGEVHHIDIETSDRQAGIATVGETGLISTADRANAVLLAAAPLMLGTLKDLRDEFLKSGLFHASLVNRMEQVIHIATDQRGARREKVYTSLCSAEEGCEIVPPGTATLVRVLESLPSEGKWSGKARLYAMIPAYCGHDFVVVSGIHNAFTTETYIFPSNSEGMVTDWGELQGSFKGDVDHALALRNAGYLTL